MTLQQRGLASEAAWATHLGIRQGDVLVDALVVVDGVLQVLQLRGEVHLAAGFAPRIHIAHVLGRLQKKTDRPCLSMAIHKSGGFVTWFRNNSGGERF